MNAQRVGLGMLIVAVLLCLVGWSQLEAGSLVLPGVASAPVAVESVASEPAPVSKPAKPSAPPAPRRPPLKVGVQSRADARPPVTMPPCTAAVKRHETVERLASVIVLVKGDLSAYATAYANAATAEVPTNCGVPPLSASRHRKALDRLRSTAVLEPDRLAAVESALGV